MLLVHGLGWYGFLSKLEDHVLWEELSECLKGFQNQKAIVKRLHAFRNISCAVVNRGEEPLDDYGILRVLRSDDGDQQVLRNRNLVEHGGAANNCNAEHDSIG